MITALLSWDRAAAHGLTRGDKRLQGFEGALDPRYQFIQKTLQRIQQRLENRTNVNAVNLVENRFVGNLQRSDKHGAGVQCVDQLHDLLIRRIDGVQQTLELTQQPILQRYNVCV